MFYEMLILGNVVLQPHLRLLLSIGYFGCQSPFQVLNQELLSGWQVKGMGTCRAGCVGCSNQGLAIPETSKEVSAQMRHPLK
jgi:hypothetical protein